MMKTFITAAIIAGALAAVTACNAMPETPPTYSTPPAVGGPAISDLPPTTRHADPYSSTGTWRVPKDIAPGVYRVELRGSTGYYAICRTVSCDIGVGGGLIKNEFLRGPGLIDIPPNAVAIQTRGLNLFREN